MVYTPHDIVKPEKYVQVGVGILQKELVSASLISHAGIDEFKGAKDDTITVRVPGRLPAREYPWRNDRTNPIVFDVYKEGKTTLSFGGHAYSGVALTDEQKEFDLGGSFGDLVGAQTSAVATKLNQSASALIEAAPYEVTIGGIEAAIRPALVEARRVLRAFGVPAGQAIMLIGTNVEAAILNDEKLTLAQNVGDANADSMLRTATIGSLLNFRFVVDELIDPDSAYAFVPSAFALRTAAPSVPMSVKFGSTVSAGGFAMRWMQDYDLDFMTDRSVFDAWYGTSTIKDYVYPAVVEPGTQFDPDTLNQYFLRGVKLTLAGTSSYPAVADPTKADLIAETKISDANPWVAPTTTP